MWARSPLASARANTLDLDLQFHFLLEPVFVAIVHSEVGAIESRRGISTADLFFRHRVDDALELADGQLHRLRHAVQRELSVDFRRRAFLELGKRTLVGGSRKLL